SHVHSHTFVLLLILCCVVHRVLHSFPTRRSSDLAFLRRPPDFLEVRRDGCTRSSSVSASSSAPRVEPSNRGSMRRLPVLLAIPRSEEHTSELQSRENLVCRLLLEKKKQRCSILL